jgi:pimeloyl-ACP methyl ester carboxylesterase
MNTIETPTSHGTVPVSYTERGDGHPFVVLHGGAGSRSVAGFAELLADRRHARVITPIHPGFDGTPRPSSIASIADLAELYVRFLDALDLEDATIVGNSIGGWITAEMALHASPRVSSVVLVDAVGLQLPDAPIEDFFRLTMDQVTDISYFEPERFRIDVRSLPDAVRETMAGNRATMLEVAGEAMGDPTLLGRLPGIGAPVLVVWGAADRMVTTAHGRAYTRAIPDARFDLIEDAGHLPQIETPERLVRDVWDFADEHATRRPAEAGH